MAGVRLALVKLIGRPLSPPGSEAFPRVAVLAQRYTLVGNNTQISARLSGAQQGEPSVSILLVVPTRVGLVCLFCNDAGGAQSPRFWGRGLLISLHLQVFLEWAIVDSNH
jgi:hypothetical protein